MKPSKEKIIKIIKNHYNVTDIEADGTANKLIEEYDLEHPNGGLSEDAVIELADEVMAKNKKNKIVASVLQKISKITHPGFTPEVITEARDWIADCSWNDLDPEEIEELTDEEVLKGVKKHYSGGLEGFLRDGDHKVASDGPDIKRVEILKFKGKNYGWSEVVEYLKMGQQYSDCRIGTYGMDPKYIVIYKGAEADPEDMLDNLNKYLKDEGYDAITEKDL